MKLAPHALEWNERIHFPLDANYQTAASAWRRAALIPEALATEFPAVVAYISIHNMCAWMIDGFGTEARHSKFLPPLIAVERLATHRLTAPWPRSTAGASTWAPVRRAAC